MIYLLLVVGLEVPAILALVDCYQRPPDHFEGGVADRASWLRWLWVAFATSWLLVGYGILLGYHWSVVRRQGPLTRG